MSGQASFALVLAMCEADPAATAAFSAEYAPDEIEPLYVACQLIALLDTGTISAETVRSYFGSVTFEEG